MLRRLHQRRRLAELPEPRGGQVLPERRQRARREPAPGPRPKSGAQRQKESSSERWSYGLVPPYSPSGKHLRQWRTCVNCRRRRLKQAFRTSRRIDTVPRSNGDKNTSTASDVKQSRPVAGAQRRGSDASTFNIKNTQQPEGATNMLKRILLASIFTAAATAAFAQAAPPAAGGAAAPPAAAPAAPPAAGAPPAGGAAGGGAAAAPQQPMSFFVTSAVPGTGNLGGLAGADKICQDLATAAGS